MVLQMCMDGAEMDPKGGPTLAWYNRNGGCGGVGVCAIGIAGGIGQRGGCHGGHWSSPSFQAQTKRVELRLQLLPNPRPDEGVVLKRLQVIYVHLPKKSLDLTHSKVLKWEPNKTLSKTSLDVKLWAMNPIHQNLAFMGKMLKMYVFYRVEQWT